MDLEARHWLIASVAALGIHLCLLALLERPAVPVGPAQGIRIALATESGATEEGAGPKELLPLGAETLETIEPESPEDAVAGAEAAARVAHRPLMTRSAPAKSSQAPRQKAERRARKPAPRVERRERTAPGHAGANARGGEERSRDGGSGSRGAATMAGGGGSGALGPAVKEEYAGQIAAWIDRNKRYPTQARSKGQQGLVRIRFTLDREGRVLASGIVESSGHAALDDEVRALMRRGPMPRMPAAMRESQVTLTVPIRFRLQ